MSSYSLKDQFFNPAFSLKLAQLIQEDYPIDITQFTNKLNQAYPRQELLERVTHTVTMIYETLPQDYEKALDILFKTASNINGFQGIIFPQYVSTYGLHHYDISLDALKFFTQYSTSEFAIRHFLKQDLLKTLTVMKGWAKDKNEHVRRLASEGSRPRLPWSFKLIEIEKTPELCLNILEQLKADDSEYVRKSIANHLNDISKAHPQFLIDVLSKWDLTQKHTKWIANHAMRTLIKQGNKEALSLKGYGISPSISIKKININPTLITLGDSLVFSFEIESTSQQLQNLNIDYIIHYMKNNGKTAPKVFKLKELILQANDKTLLKKKHAFKNFTTRKHYQGIHHIEILINGQKFNKTSFELTL